MITTGEIGAMYCGDTQVGGLLHWEARVDISNSKHPKTLIAARALWTFEDIQADNLRLMLYQRVGNKLALALECPVTVTRMPTEIKDDILVKSPVEMVYEHTTL